MGSNWVDTRHSTGQIWVKLADQIVIMHSPHSQPVHRLCTNVPNPTLNYQISFDWFSRSVGNLFTPIWVQVSNHGEREREREYLQFYTHMGPSPSPTRERERQEESIYTHVGPSVQPVRERSCCVMSVSVWERERERERERETVVFDSPNLLNFIHR